MKDYGPSRRGDAVDRRVEKLVQHLRGKSCTRAELCDTLAARMGGQKTVESTLNVAQRRGLITLDTKSKPGRFSLAEAGSSAGTLSRTLEAAAAGSVARAYGASPERAREIAENVAAGREPFGRRS